MGSSSNSSSSNPSVSSSYNTILSSTISGTNNVGITATGGITNSPLSYSYSTSDTSLGASSPISSGMPTNGQISGGIDWNQVLIYVLGGLALVVVLHFLGVKGNG